MHDGRSQFRSVSRTHTGCVRPHNEDALIDRADIGVWAVSDGMGGHAAGDVASARVVSAIKSLKGGGTTAAALRQALLQANEDLVRQGAGSPERTMGATVTVLVSDGKTYFCLWAGDSRLYQFRDGTMTQLTRDHRYVQDLLDAGMLSEDEARQHPRRNVITRAVGVAPELKLDTDRGEVQPGDIFILMTDGVSGVCTDAEIAAIISGGALDAAADALVQRCLEHGAPDNLTLLLVEKLKD